MAKKKKKTLPKNFDELIKAGDITALKAVFEECELEAYGGYGKETALHFYGVPNELVRWLVEQGANINAEDTYGRTPLYAQATIGSNIVELLLDLGANIQLSDHDGNTPLHIAAGYFRVDTVQFLIERGANIHAVNNSKQTPLAYALALCNNIGISNMAKIATLLLKSGATVTSEMSESVKRIGKDFEFHRDNFNKDYLTETEEGLSKLYSIFGVEAVAKRRVHDGVSKITVTNKVWQKQHHELWEFLVPSQGVAQTMQGEVIRITGRISDELYRNGGANWDSDYRKMLDTLLQYLASGTPLSLKELSTAAELATIIRPKGDSDDESDHLCELAVKWVLANPLPIMLDKPNYKR